MLGLVRLNGATRIHSLKRKDQAGHVEYWKAQCGESRMLRLGGGKERKLLPIRTKGLSSGNHLACQAGRNSISTSLAVYFMFPREQSCSQRNEGATLEGGREHPPDTGMQGR